MNSLPRLYAISHYSLGRSVLSPKALPKLAKAQGVAGLCDVDALAGAFEFSLAARSAGVKAVLGQRLTLGELELCCHAINAEGWTALCRIADLAARKQARLDSVTPLLRSGLFTALSSECAAVRRWAADGDAEVAALIEALPVHSRGVALARSEGGREGRAVAQAAVGLGLPILAAPIVGSADPADLDVLAALSENGPAPWPTTSYMSDADLTALYEDVPNALANVATLAQACNFQLEAAKPRMPSFPDAPDERAALRAMAAEGLERRLAVGGVADRAAYDDRLAMELDFICQLGFAGYFLIVADFIGYARANGIPVGPGRGSGAGSLVAWCIGVTDLDPIRLGLYFERFINPARVSPPDFDVDFCEAKRDRIVAYIVAKYGADHVAQIGAWQTLQPKAAWRTAARALALTPGQANRIAALVPPKAKTLEDAIAEARDLKEAIAADVEAAEAMTAAAKIGGAIAHRTRHPAGVVLCDEPLASVTPLIDNDGGPSGILATQFDMKSIDHQGLIKFDLLGLKTLTVIDRARELVAAQGEIIEPWAIGYEDKAVFAMLNSGWTTNVFQLESAGMVKAIKQVRIDNFEDIVALLSLYRPGPMDQIEVYAERKAGRKPVVYPHPALESVLKTTYGIPIYQEQIMDLARKLAGYSLGEADLLRRAMGKKIPEEMAKLEESFIAGCIANEALEPRMSEANAREIFAMVSRFAGYGFNRSHAAAYARITFVTAWLKAHYYHAYIAACMDQDQASTARLQIDVAETRKLKVEIAPVDINASGPLFGLTGAGDNVAILYAISGLKGIGRDLAERIAAERDAGGPYFSFDDFRSRLGRGISRAQLTTLVHAGAFDATDPTLDPAQLRAACLANLEGSASGAGLFLDAPGEAAVAPLERADMIAREIETYGFAIASHPTDAFERLYADPSILPLDKAAHAAKTVSVRTLVTIVNPSDDGGRIAVLLDNGRTRLAATMAPGLMPPKAQAHGPMAVVATLARGRQITAWQPASAVTPGVRASAKPPKAAAKRA